MCGDFIQNLVPPHLIWLAENSMWPAKASHSFSHLSCATPSLLWSLLRGLNRFYRLFLKIGFIHYFWSFFLLFFDYSKLNNCFLRLNIATCSFNLFTIVSHNVLVCFSSSFLHFFFGELFPRVNLLNLGNLFLQSFDFLVDVHHIQNTPNLTSNYNYTIASKLRYLICQTNFCMVLCMRVLNFLLLYIRC